MKTNLMQVYEVYHTEEGWWSRLCYPVCIPESKRNGPFDTAEEARAFEQELE